MDLIDEILQACAIGESTDWEFKSAKGGFPGSFWETYSAMANSDGGRVVLGVREKDGKAFLDGLTADEIGRHQKILWDGLNDKGRVNINLLDSRNVQVVPFQKAFLMVVEIPRATRTQKPVYLAHGPWLERTAAFMKGITTVRKPRSGACWPMPIPLRGTTVS